MCINLSNKEKEFLKLEIAYELGRQVKQNCNISIASQRTDILKYVDIIANELIKKLLIGEVEEIVDIDLIVNDFLKKLDN
jgi:hypothetical protein